MNNLYQQMNSNAVSKFMNFAKNYKGNPQQAVMELLSSGRMTQDQFNHLQNMANEFMKLLPKNR